MELVLINSVDEMYEVAEAERHNKLFLLPDIFTRTCTFYKWEYKSSDGTIFLQELGVKSVPEDMFMLRIKGGANMFFAPVDESMTFFWDNNKLSYSRQLPPPRTIVGKSVNPYVTLVEGNESGLFWTNKYNVAGIEFSKATAANIDFDSDSQFEWLLTSNDSNLQYIDIENEEYADLLLKSCAPSIIAIKINALHYDAYQIQEMLYNLPNLLYFYAYNYNNDSRIAPINSSSPSSHVRNIVYPNNIKYLITSPTDTALLPSMCEVSYAYGTSGTVESFVEKARNDGRISGELTFRVSSYTDYLTNITFNGEKIISLELGNWVKVVWDNTSISLEAGEEPIVYGLNIKNYKQKLLNINTVQNAPAIEEPEE